MRRTGLLIVLLWMVPSLLHAAEGFDEGMAASVFGTALAFMAPRTLDVEGIPQLTEWGMRGLTAVDPSLVPEVREQEIRLLQAGKPVFSAPLPAGDDATGWGALAARMSTAAFAASESVRQVGTEGVMRSFFDELFNHLDPYSRYVPPGAADTERDRRAGQAGLGITLVREGGGVTIHDVTPSSPADDAGLRPGDRIVSVDGRLVRGEAATVVAGWIAGPDGTSVRLAWRNRGRPRQASIERALVPPQTVTAERLDDLVLIHISGFSVDTDDQFAAALQAGFAGHKVRGVVIDLRGNRGGLLRQAISIADMMVINGVVTTTAGRNPQSSHVWPGGTGVTSLGRQPPTDDLDRDVRGA